MIGMRWMDGIVWTNSLGMDENFGFCLSRFFGEKDKLFTH